MAFASHAPAANTAAVVTLAAKPDRRLVVLSIHWSFSADPAAAALLTVTSANAPTYTEYVTKGGPGYLDFGDGYMGGDGQSVVVTLAAGGSGVTGTLNVVSTEED